MLPPCFDFLAVVIVDLLGFLNYDFDLIVVDTDYGVLDIGFLYFLVLSDILLVFLEDVNYFLIVFEMFR